MMRRSVAIRYYWSRYRLPVSAPQINGPPPEAAPQNMNNTTTNMFVDPIDDNFPRSIRGNLVRPDVSEDQYVDAWYLCSSLPINQGEYMPWSSTAPANAFRFRPFNEFDAKGREYVEKMRSFAKYNVHKSRGKGSEGFPFREAYLTKMASSTMRDVNTNNHFHVSESSNYTTSNMKAANEKRTSPSLQTIMDRAIARTHQHNPTPSPLEVQRDVGRLEAVLPSAGKTNADASTFPFRWHTEDWYEYEIAKVRNKRFTFVNTEEDGINGSEVTYRIILDGFWDHHVSRLAEDVCMYFKDVGRQIMEEKLKSVRDMLLTLESGAIDPELLVAFNSAQRGPFGRADEYDSDEVIHFLRADLTRLEEQCIGVINRCNVPIPAATNLYDAQVSWPFVERLEPWVRMAEFWTSASPLTFAENEMSSVHYEFRKYFRVVVIKLPFQSSEFEQRMYDLRHWLHRQTSCEFHTTYRRNIVHDASIYPTEHDPSVLTSHEHHRLFSFALDWQSGPVNYLATYQTQHDESWENVATRLGCTVSELQRANPQLLEDNELENELSNKVVDCKDNKSNSSNHVNKEESSKLSVLPAGQIVNVPLSATRKLTSFGATPRILPLEYKTITAHAEDTKEVNDSTNVVMKRIQTWEEAAQLLDCTVEELQQVNGSAALTYNNESGFDNSVKELNVPHTAWECSESESFSPTELVYESDTLQSIAQRLDCTVAALREANHEILAKNSTSNENELANVTELHVPASARRPRRLIHPQLQSQTATNALLSRTHGEQRAFKLNDHNNRILTKPENASRFPHEYHTTASRFPVTPRQPAWSDNWMSYTAAYLDKEFNLRTEPTPVYNVNKAWPLQQVPGKIDQTPFEEDQTWLLHPIPVQQSTRDDPEKDLQDLPFVNHEQFPRSLEWLAP